MTPRISVLAAVRERAQVLDRMLRSLDSTVTDKNSVEVILRCDYDDDQVVSYLRMRGWEQSVIMGPRLEGYRSCPVFLNQAARLSRGQLLLVVNDDAVFETRGWDEKLLWAAAQHKDGVFVLGVDTHNGGNFPFTCVSRRTTEILGFLVDERLVYTDIWMRDVMQALGRAVRVLQVTIRHEWQGMTADQAVAQKRTTTQEYQQLYERCVAEAVAKILRAEEGLR